MLETNERREWLAKRPNDVLSKRLKIVAWVITGLVLVLVSLMRNPSLRIPLPEGVSLGFLPAVHAILNTCVAVLLVSAAIAVMRGKITVHKNLMLTAMGFSVLFLLCYVAYHFTTVETKFGGDGWVRSTYLFLLITHIVAAGISLPLILLTFIAAWTSRFAAHKKLARWVFPIWLYVAITGPICYLMLRPYY